MTQFQTPPQTSVTLKPDLATAIEHAQRMTEPVIPPEGFEGRPVILVPSGWQQQPVADWGLQKLPRIFARLEFTDHGSFCTYVNDWKRSETIVLCQADKEQVRFQAIIDYHRRIDGGDDPQWCKHQAWYTPVWSDEFAAWREKDRKPMTQLQFAQWLEDRTMDVHTPSGADLLHIINAFEMEGELTFSRVQRLQDGSIAMHYVNETKAKNSTLTVPDVFRIAIPVFQGDPPIVIDVRLRYRLAPDGKLSLWFEIVAIDKLLRQAVHTVVERVAVGTAIRPLIAKLGDVLK